MRRPSARPRATAAAAEAPAPAPAAHPAAPASLPHAAASPVHPAGLDPHVAAAGTAARPRGVAGQLLAWATALAAAVGAAPRALGALAVTVVQAVLARVVACAKAPATADGASLRLTAPEVARQRVEAGLREFTSGSLTRRAVGEDGVALPVCPLFAVDLPRSHVELGDPGAVAGSLRDAAASLVELCDGDRAWAHRVSGMLSQNVGNTIIAALFHADLVALGPAMVGSWAYTPAAGQSTQAHRFHASRRGDDMVVDVSLTGDLARVDLAAGGGKGPARARHAGGTLVLGARIVVARPGAAGEPAGVRLEVLRVGISRAVAPAA